LVLSLHELAVFGLHNDLFSQSASSTLRSSMMGLTFVFH
jgi:hypothetical protein